MKSKRAIVISMITILIFSMLIGCGDIASNVYNNNKKLARDEETWSLDTSNQLIEKGQYEGEFILTGACAVWEYDSPSEFDLKVPYKLTVNKGKAKIVLITPDNEVVTLVENTDKATVSDNTNFTLPIKKGLNRIKIAGNKKADIKLEMKIDKGTFKKIGFD